MQYSAIFLEHFDHPQHGGSLPVAPDVVSSRQATADQREVLLLSVRWQEERVVAARFLAAGNPVLLGAAEWLCRWLVGRSAVELQALAVSVLLQTLQLPEHASATLLLALTAAQRSVIAPWVGDG